MSSTPILAKIAVSAAKTAESKAQTCQEGKVSGLMDGPSSATNRHCEERSDEAIHTFLLERWVASRSLSSGAHSRDPLARNDVEPLATAVSQLRSSGSTGSGETSTPSSISARASSGEASP